MYNKTKQTKTLIKFKFNVCFLKDLKKFPAKIFWNIVHFALQKPEKNTFGILSAYIMITNGRAAGCNDQFC